MPSRQYPIGFTVTRDCVIDGVAFARDDVIAAEDASEIKKLNVLVANRTLLPGQDPSYRKTDAYGFGEDPRRIPTPTAYGAGEVKEM